MRPNITGRVAAFGGVVTLCLLAQAPAALASTPGSNENTFTIGASAVGFDVDVVDNGAPVINEYDAGNYGAAAQLDSLGQSTANAGAPYAPVINTLPPLVNGLGSGGQLPPVPDVPGFVSAAYPGNPSSTQTQGPYDIRAVTKPYDARGAATLGVSTAQTPSSNFYALAQTTSFTDGSVVAHGIAKASVINLGGVLDLGDVSSELTLTESGSAKPVIKGSTSLGTVTVAGLTTGLLNGAPVLGGIQAGQATPVTTTLLPTLNTLLKASGVTLTVVPTSYVYTDGTRSTGPTPKPSKTVQSVDSGGLQMQSSRNVPSQGKVVFTTTVGRVILSATNTKGSAPTLPTGPSAPTGGGSTGGSTSGSSTGAAVVPPATTDSTGGGSVQVPSDGGSSTGGTSTAIGGTGGSVTPPASATGGTAAQPVAVSPLAYHFGPSVESLYLILVLAAVGSVIGAFLLKLLGVRLAFLSD